MRARQNHHAGGGFRDGRVEIVRVRAHHQAAEDEHRIVRGQSAGKFNAFAERRANGHSQRRRRFHRAGNGEHLVRERLAVVGGGDVHKRLDVVHDHADRDGNAAGRNQFAGDVIDQIVFVARRIIIAQQLHAHIRAFGRRRCTASTACFFLPLTPMTPSRAPTASMASCMPRTSSAALSLHDDRVLVQQRFAFRAVGDDGFRLGVELDVRRKTAAARAHHAGLPDFFCKIHWLIKFRTLLQARSQSPVNNRSVILMLVSRLTASDIAMTDWSRYSG